MKLKVLLFFIAATLIVAFNNCTKGPNSTSSSSVLKGEGTTTIGNGMNCNDQVACLPKVYLNSDYPELSPHRRVLTVGAANRQYKNCQEAIDAAEPGDEIVIDAGYVCAPIHLRDKGRSQQTIVIRTSNISALPNQGSRIRRTDSANLAVIETRNGSIAPVVAESHSHHYQLVGLEIRTHSSVASLTAELVNFNFSLLQDPDGSPHDIVIARSWIHAYENQEVIVGIQFNGNALSIVDSIVEEIHNHNHPAEGISGWQMGAGPFKIVNNEITSAGAGIQIGGNVTTPELIPSDIEIRKNWIHKPLKWRQSITSLTNQKGPWTSGSLVSFSNAQRILMSGNVIENQWVQSTPGANNSGFAVEFYPLSDSASVPGSEKWVVVQDITFSNNIIRHVAGAFHILYQNPQIEGAITKRLKFENNLVYDVGPEWGEGQGLIHLEMQATGPVWFNHNTLLNVQGAGPNLITAWAHPGTTFTEFMFTNNLINDEGGGIVDPGDWNTGTDTLDHVFPGIVLRYNALAGQDVTKYKGYTSTNFFPSGLSAIGFMADPTTGVTDIHSLQLSPSSPYSKAAEDGRDIGADILKIEAALK